MWVWAARIVLIEAGLNRHGAGVRITTCARGVAANFFRAVVATAARAAAVLGAAAAAEISAAAATAVVSTATSTASPEGTA